MTLSPAAAVAPSVRWRRRVPEPSSSIRNTPLAMRGHGRFWIPTPGAGAEASRRASLVRVHDAPLAPRRSGVSRTVDGGSRRAARSGT